MKMGGSQGGPEAKRGSVSYEIVVLGAGQAGLGMGYFLERQGAQVRDPRRGRFDRFRLARPLRLAHVMMFSFNVSPAEAD